MRRQLAAFLAGVVVSVGAMRLTSVRTASIVLRDPPRAHAPRMQFGGKKWQEAQKRKEAERATYEKLAEQAAKNEEQKQLKLKEEQAAQQAKAEQAKAQAASYQDNVDFYRPGGVMRQPTVVLTREGMANARKTTSPAIEADERVQQVVKDVGSMPPGEAVEALKQAIAAALEAGVRENSPTMKKAKALMGTLSTAAAAAAADDLEKTDPQKDAFDALFGGGYAMPNDDDLDLPP